MLGLDSLPLLYRFPWKETLRLVVKRQKVLYLCYLSVWSPLDMNRFQWRFLFSICKRLEKMLIMLYERVEKCSNGACWMHWSCIAYIPLQIYIFYVTVKSESNYCSGSWMKSLHMLLTMINKNRNWISLPLIFSLFHRQHHGQCSRQWK